MYLYAVLDNSDQSRLVRKQMDCHFGNFDRNYADYYRSIVIL